MWNLSRHLPFILNVIVFFVISLSAKHFSNFLWQTATGETCIMMNGHCLYSEILFKTQYRSNNKIAAFLKYQFQPFSSLPICRISLRRTQLMCTTTKCIRNLATIKITFLVSLDQRLVTQETKTYNKGRRLNKTHNRDFTVKQYYNTQSQKKTIRYILVLYLTIPNI